MQLHPEEIRDTNLGNAEIRHAALLCKTEIVASISNRALTEQSWLRAALGDFNLWCDGLKTLSSDKSSLDYRLRERPDVREAICDLLGGLQGALQTIKQLVSVDAMTENGNAESDHRPVDEYPDSPQSSLSWEVMSDESNDEASMPDEECSIPTLSEYVSYVKTFLRQLMRISLAIRKSGNKYRFERMDAACDDRAYGTFRQHLTTIILRSMEDPEAEKLDVAEKIQRASDPSRLTSIQERLIRANVLRRNRIAIMSKDDGLRNSSDLDTDTLMLHSNDGHITPSEVGLTTNSEPTPSTAEASRKSTLKRPGQSINSSMVMTATEPGSNLDIKGILARKALSGATKITRIGASQAYPRCPDFNFEGALVCPYCCDPLPLDISGTKLEDTWKAHIVQDLIPYTCIIDDCDFPDEMYLTAQGLLAHMIDKHSVTRWTCDLCAIGEKEGERHPIHKQPLFASIDQWETHFVTTHGEIKDSTLITTEAESATVPRSISTSERGTLAELNKRQMIGPLSCPLCEFSAESMDTKIDDHILQHLHEFSLRALPEGSGERLEKTVQTSQSINPLSHTQQEDKSFTGALEYRPTTLAEVETVLDATWSLLDKISPKPTLDNQPAGDEISVELWQATARNLLENLFGFKAFLQDDYWDDRKTHYSFTRASEVAWVTEVNDLVDEMNSVLTRNQQDPKFRRSDSPHLTYGGIRHTRPLINGLGKDILDRLDETYLFPKRESSAQSRIALVGTTLRDSTAIAASFVDNLREHSKDCIVFWVEARTRSLLLNSLTQIASMFTDSASGVYPVSQFSHYLNWSLDADWLMVIDGINYTTAIYLSLQNLLPQGLRGTLLFVTTDDSCLELLGPVKRIQVPDLDISEEKTTVSWSDKEELDIPKVEPIIPFSSNEAPELVEEGPITLESRGGIPELPKEVPIIQVPSEWESNSYGESDMSEEEPVLQVADEEPLLFHHSDSVSRPYTSALSVPAPMDEYGLRETTIISDAGDQQQLRSKLKPAQSEDPPDENHDLELVFAQLPQGPRHELQEAILNARQRTQNIEGRSRSFIPNEDLRRIINLESVTKELRKELSAVHSPGQIRSYARQICRESMTVDWRTGRQKIKTFHKVFALLVLVEAASLILLFLEEDVSDQDLPLSMPENQAGFEVYRRGDQNKVALRCFKHNMWSPVRLENFIHYQWEMLAPFFGSSEGSDVKHYVLRNEHILPFVSDDTDHQNAAKEGAFSQVHMVRIHPDHQNFRDEDHSQRGFAVKRLYENDRKDFQNEAKILKQFSGERSHPHVVSLLATYEQSNKFHFIFRRAEGDLYDLWKNIIPQPEISYANVLWIIEQCAGIAEGLSMFHRSVTSARREVIAQKIEMDENTGRVVRKKIRPFSKSRIPTYIRPVTDALRQVDASSDSVELFAQEHDDDTAKPQPGKQVRFIVPKHDQAGTNPVISPDELTEQDNTPTEVPDQPSEVHPTQGSVSWDDESQVMLFGRHGDINPSNILWFDNNAEVKVGLRGTLKIADFGNADVASSQDRSKPIHLNATYRAPECDMRPAVIRQSSDIWGLGCVFLEFITWFLGGQKLLERFTHKRLSPDKYIANIKSDTFFQVKGDSDTQDLKFSVKPSVTQFIADLRQHPQCMPSLLQFLDLIEHDMIVVESDECRRKSSKSISSSLRDISEKWSTHEN